jgi:N6-adenosine-specific RNA methylase IME4
MLRGLFKHKDDLIAVRATPPFYLQSDLRTFPLTSLGTHFDVVLIDPPWEEYYNRTAHMMPGLSNVTDSSKPFWTYDELAALEINAITASPSFLFLWVGSGGEALDEGRHLLNSWGFRRSEDIVWVKTNKENSRANINAAREKNSTFIRTKEHCLLGIKGSVRRNTDAHIIHANVDTDVIISEEPELGSLRKPEELYHIIEHFCLGRRRLELFAEDHNIRPGWVTVGNKISSSNWNSEIYCAYFEGPNGNLLGTTVEIEKNRPKSPNRDDSKILYYLSTKQVVNKGPPDRD